MNALEYTANPIYLFELVLLNSEPNSRQRASSGIHILFIQPKIVFNRRKRVLRKCCILHKNYTLLKISLQCKLAATPFAVRNFESSMRDCLTYLDRKLDIEGLELNRDW